MEQARPSTKEAVVPFALQHDAALIRRGLEIYRMNKVGTAEFISKSTNYEYL